MVWAILTSPEAAEGLTWTRQQRSTVYTAYGVCTNRREVLHVASAREDLRRVPCCVLRLWERNSIHVQMSIKNSRHVSQLCDSSVPVFITPIAIATFATWLDVLLKAEMFAKGAGFAAPQ